MSKNGIIGGSKKGYLDLPPHPQGKTWSKNACDLWTVICEKAPVYASSDLPGCIRLLFLVDEFENYPSAEARYEILALARQYYLRKTVELLLEMPAGNAGNNDMINEIRPKVQGGDPIHNIL